MTAMTMEVVVRLLLLLLLVSYCEGLIASVRCSINKQVHALSAAEAADGVPLDSSSSSGSISSQSTPRKRIPTTSDLRWQVQAVGVVSSPYIDKFGTPKQATISARQDASGGEEGSIQVFEEYRECLDQMEGFDYIWVLSLMHLNRGFKTKIRPQPRPGAEKQPPVEVGLFCSRAPHRPNPIALSALRVTHIDHERGVIYVKGLDLLHDTPVLDIKPYIPAFDSFPQARGGWMDDICSDVELSRQVGYQTIKSPRGARMARRAIKQKAKEDEAQEVEQEEKEAQH